MGEAHEHGMQATHQPDPPGHRPEAAVDRAALGLVPSPGSVPPGLQTAPYLNRPVNRPVRVAMVQRMQQTYGNRATRRWLQRAPAAPQATGAPPQADQAPASAPIGPGTGIPALLQRFPNLVVATRLQEMSTLQQDHTRTLGALNAANAAVMLAQPPELSAQDSANLGKAAQSSEVITAKAAVQKDQVDIANAKLAIDGDRVQLTERLGVIAGLKQQLAGAQLRKQADQDQSKLNEVQDKLETMKNVFTVIGSVGGALTGEMTALVVAQALEQPKAFQNKRAEDFANVGVTQLVQNGLQVLVGKLTGLTDQADQLQKKIEQNLAGADNGAILGLAAQAKAHATALTALNPILQAKLSNLVKLGGILNDHMLLLSRTLKKQPGLENLQVFDQIRADTDILDRFDAAGAEFAPVAKEYRAKLLVVQGLLVVGPLFSDPDAKAARDYVNLELALTAGDDQYLKDGQARAATLRTKVSQAMSASMAAMPTPAQ